MADLSDLHHRQYPSGAHSGGLCPAGAVLVRYLAHFFQKIIDIGNRKIGKLGSYELLGLYLFVAIPLPGTGAWTGCLIATLLQMKLRPAFCAISLGVVTSGIIMWLASSGVFGFLSLFA